MKAVRRTSIAIAAAAAAFTLVACSSSSEDSASTATTAAATAAAESAEAGAMESAASAGTIVDVAKNTAGFETLVAAVEAAGLGETLSGEGPFTVFAPNEAAFQALPEGLIEALLKPENKDVLAKILKYHVVSGTVMAADVTDGEVATVEGQPVTLSTMDGVSVNGAKVVQADVVADNGVIHVIDAVILPPDVDPSTLLAQ